MPLPPPGPPPGVDDMMGAMPPMGGGPPGGPPGGLMGEPSGPGGGQPSVGDLLSALKLLPSDVKTLIISELSKPDTGEAGAPGGDSIKKAAAARAGV